MPGRSLLLATSAASLLLAFACAEVFLRVSGLGALRAPPKLAIHDRITDSFDVDPDLFWVTKDYADELAAFGDGSPTVAHLGDSCTHLGRYPQLLANLAQQGSSSEYRFLNAGVSGWSSHQGLAQLRRDIAPLSPTVVTLYFGWNDHWLSFTGRTDEQEAAGPALSDGWLGRSKLVTLALSAAAHRTLPTREPPPLRVPEARFRDNLLQMIDVSRSNGIVPVLITAPSALEEGDVPKRLRPHFVRDLDRVIPLHERYVAIVREVAEAEGVPLLDLAERFDAIPMAERRARYFHEDGIHLREPGDALIAGWLYELLVGAAHLLPGRPQSSQEATAAER